MPPGWAGSAHPPVPHRTVTLLAGHRDGSRIDAQDPDLARSGVDPSPPVPSPEAWFGFRPRAERKLARWPQLLAYFRALAAASDRVIVEDLGPATLGQPLALLTVSSAQNLARRDEIRDIQQRLVDPARRTPADLDRLIADGRCVCLITAGIHATEVGGPLMTPELVFHLATAEDEATRRIRDQVILLVMPSLNPDGLELVADWYDRTLGTPHEGSLPPELYHPYAGHDNNRDWFMQTQIETRTTVRTVHRPWRPQIVLDLHQMQSTGPRYVLPPYIDPYDPNVDGVIQAQVNALGTSIAADMTLQGKRGVTTSVIFDAYSPSRAYAHYHGGVRILAEAASARIATRIWQTPNQLVETAGFDPRVPTQNHPEPWAGGFWSLSDIIDYHQTAALATLDHAARFCDRWLRTMATIQDRAVGRRRPFAFVVPPLSSQRDPSAAQQLIDLLRAGDIEVRTADTAFTADGAKTPAGTFVVPLAQPFGAYAKTLLEIQQYPAVRTHPAAPPRPPYDVTGHTLPLMMGVDAVEVNNPFQVPTSLLPANLPTPVGIVAGGNASSFHVPGTTNSSATLVNRALAAGARVSRIRRRHAGASVPLNLGDYVISDLPAARLGALAADAGAAAVGLEPLPPDCLVPLSAPRVALYRSWRSNAIDEGWTRFVLEDHGFSIRTLRDHDIRHDGLHLVADVIILPHQPSRDIVDGNNVADYPTEFAGGIGLLGTSNLRRFVDEGGTLVAVDGACDVAMQHLSLPVANVLDGLRADEFSCPGSLLRLHIDPNHPLGWGYPPESVAMFVSSPAFARRPGGTPEPSEVARYPTTNPLLSGWIHGHERISGASALVEVPFGRGRVVLFGFRPLFRAQTRVSYRLLFNALVRSTLHLSDPPRTDPGGRQP